jgi:hypothetical protein
MWCVLRTIEMDVDELSTAMHTVWAAMGARVANIREALSLSLQKQLIHADSASREAAAKQQLEVLMLDHKVQRLLLSPNPYLAQVQGSKPSRSGWFSCVQDLDARCKQQQAHIEQQQILHEANLSELQLAAAASAGATTSAQAESAASMARCAALQERLDILQQQCDALHLNCQRQLSELAAAAESNARLQQQLAAMQQEHEHLQRQHTADATAAATSVVGLQDELSAVRRKVAELQAGSQQLLEVHATQLQQCNSDWELKLDAEQQFSAIRLQEAAVAAAAAQETLEQQCAMRLQQQSAADAAAAEDKVAALAAQHQAEVR